MIFSPITKLSSKAEKAFCFELIDVYCRHIEVYCQAHEINIPKRSLSNEIISELKSIGLVKVDEDVAVLQRELKGGFSRFIVTSDDVKAVLKGEGSILEFSKLDYIYFDYLHISHLNPRIFLACQVRQVQISMPSTPFDARFRHLTQASAKVCDKPRP